MSVAVVRKSALAVVTFALLLSGSAIAQQYHRTASRAMKLRRWAPSSPSWCNRIVLWDLMTPWLFRAARRPSGVVRGAAFLTRIPAIGPTKVANCFSTV